MADGGNSLINLGSTVEKIYDHLLGPTFKKVGEALAGITGTVLSHFRNYEHNNAMNDLLSQYELNQTKLVLGHNLEKLKNRLEYEKEDDVQPAPAHIAKPIWDRLTYVSNEELSDLFISLLTNASSRNGAHLAHPAFVHIIDRLSVDEAKILSELAGEHLYVLMVTGGYRTGPESKLDIQGFSEFRMVINENLVKLEFPEALYMYLENLKSLGLLEEDEKVTTTIDHVLPPRLIATIEKDVLKNLGELEFSYPTLISSNYIGTSLYENFRKACIPVRQS